MHRPIRIALRIVLALLLIAVYLFIFGNSLKTRGESNAVSDPLAEAIQAILDPQHTVSPTVFSFYIRKAAHFGEFFLLGALWLLFLSAFPRRFPHCSPLFALGAVVLSASTDELLQSLSDRTPALSDVLIDTWGGATGILFSLLFTLLLVHFLKRRRKTLHDTP